MSASLHVVEGARARHYLVRREDRAGRVGWGEALAWPGFGATPEHLEADLQALIEGALDELEACAPARAAWACAALDLRAQLEGLPLARLLHPQAAARIASHALVTHPEVAAAVVAAGAPALKIKIGGLKPHAALQRVAAIRRAVGPEVPLRVDVNGAWSMEEAPVLLRALGRFDLEWLEQPLPAAHLEEIAALRRLRICPIAVDESVAVCGIEAALKAQAADVYVLKPTALGGARPTLRAGRLARIARRRICVTHSLGGAVERRAALHVALALAAEGPIAAGLSNPGGYTPWQTLPERPGLGIAP